MNHAVSLPVGIIVAREKLGDPWQRYRWRPIDLTLDPPQAATWREIGRGRDVVHYQSGRMYLRLLASEKMAYRVNLANGVPSVYVVMRESPSRSSAQSVTIPLVTVSPFEIQSYGERGVETIERLEMPREVVDIVRAFIGDAGSTAATASPRLSATDGRIGGLKFGF